MTRYPVDSAEAREMREAEQEAARPAAGPEDRTPAPDASQAAQQPHDERCRGGWLGEDPDGRPVPCLFCRPHLLDVRCPTCGARTSMCRDQLDLRGVACCDARTHHQEDRPC